MMLSGNWVVQTVSPQYWTYGSESVPRVRSSRPLDRDKVRQLRRSLSATPSSASRPDSDCGALEMGQHETIRRWQNAHLDSRSCHCGVFVAGDRLLVGDRRFLVDNRRNGHGLEDCFWRGNAHGARRACSRPGSCRSGLRRKVVPMHGDGCRAIRRICHVWGSDRNRDVRSRDHRFYQGRLDVNERSLLAQPSSSSNWVTTGTFTHP